MTQKAKKDDARTALDGILSLDAGACEVQLCLASMSDGDAPDIQRVQISQDVAEEFRSVIKKTIERRKKDADKGDLVLKDYDAQAKLDRHEVERLDLTAHDSIKSQLSGLANVESLDAFSADDSFVANLRFYVMVLRPKFGDPVLFFRTYTPKKELNRSALFAIVSRQGTYDRFTDSLFLFDQHVDCMVRGDELFIFNKDKFQKIFRFYEMLIAGAKQTLQAIQQRVPIDDFAAFEAACEGHLQKLSKLKNIASKPYLQSITIADLKKVIKKYSLSIQTVGKGQNEKIQFDSSDKWAILRLLDDDYLESVMTGESYEVNSKRPM